jgi:hypothetical protein
MSLRQMRSGQGGRAGRILASIAALYNMTRIALYEGAMTGVSLSRLPVLRGTVP